MLEEQKKQIFQQPEIISSDSGRESVPSGGASRADQNDEAYRTGGGGQNNQSGSSWLPPGRQWFVLAIIFIAVFCAPIINLAHAATLNSLFQLTGEKNFSWRIDSASDLSAAYSAVNLSGTGESVLRNMIALCQSRFGDKDEYTAYARLSLARMLQSSGRDEMAWGEIEKALPALDSPDNKMPKGTTSCLLQLAQHYDHQFSDGLFAWPSYKSEAHINKAVAAKQLYGAAVRCWPISPGNGTLSNTEADLAVACENLGEYQNAATHMNVAYQMLKSWGATQFNIFRAGNLCRYYNELEQYAKADEFGEQAVTLAKKGLPYNDSFRLNAVYELARTKYHLGAYKEAYSLLPALMDSASDYTGQGTSNLTKLVCAVADGLHRRGDIAGAKDLYKQLLNNSVLNDAGHNKQAIIRAYQNLNNVSGKK